MTTNAEEARATHPIPQRSRSVVALNINESRTMNLIAELERRGFHVMDYTTSKWRDLVASLYSFTQAVRSADFVLCGTTIPVQIPWMLWVRALQRPCIIDCPMDITEWPFSSGRRWKWLVGLALRSANYVVTIPTRAYMADKFSLPKSRVRFVDNCPDLSRIEAARGARPRFVPRAGTFLLCWSGGHEHHRLERFMPIFKALVELMPQAELLIIADTAKPSVVESRLYADAAGLGHRIHVLPVIKPAEEFYATIAQCHMWLATLGDDTLQGRQELRMELLEVGSMGKAVISAATPALRDHDLTDGQEVLYIDPADPRGSALKIAELAKSPTSLSTLGQNLRAFVVDRFSLKTAVDHLLDSMPAK